MIRTNRQKLGLKSVFTSTSLSFPSLHAQDANINIEPLCGLGTPKHVSKNHGPGLQISGHRRLQVGGPAGHRSQVIFRRSHAWAQVAGHRPQAVCCRAQVESRRLQAAGRKSQVAGPSRKTSESQVAGRRLHVASRRLHVSGRTGKKKNK